MTELLKRVPRDPAENVRFRRRLLLAAQQSRQLRDDLVGVCSTDLLFWIGAFVWQFNPTQTAGREVGPFVPWPCQETAVLDLNAAVEAGEDRLIEKSRDMGASYLSLILWVWRWRFKRYQKLHMISRKAELVDDDDPDSLFWKIDFIVKHMPGWMLPAGFTSKCRTEMLLENPENGSKITGEATTGKAGVGGRATAMFIDEFSQIAADQEVLKRTSDTTKCRIFNGTHLGTTTAFYQLSRNPDVKKLVLHWSHHPEKRLGLYRTFPDSTRVEILDTAYQFPVDYKFVRGGLPDGGPFPGVRSPWYDAQIARKGNDLRAVAMDLDINPTSTVTQFFDPIKLSVARGRMVRPPVWEGEVEGEVDAGRLVRSRGGSLRLWELPRPDGRFVSGVYGVGTDVSQGTGNTNSVLSVVRLTTGEKVGELTTPRVDPSEFGTLAVTLCRIFADDAGEGASLIWESAGPGALFGRRVYEKLGYRRVYWTRDEEKSRNRSRTDKLGWQQSETAKLLLLGEYREALWAGRFFNPSERALEECLKFKYSPRGNVVHAEEESADDPSGARMNHADIAIADALAWQLAKGVFEEALPPPPPPPPPNVLSLQWRRRQAQLAASAASADWDQG